MITHEDARDVLKWLKNEVYTPAGNPPVENPPNRRLVGHPLDDEGIAVWLISRYTNLRQLAHSHQGAKDEVYRSIQRVVTPPAPSGPWKESWSPNDVRDLVLSGRLGPPTPHEPQRYQERIFDHVRDPQWGLHRRPNGARSAGVVAFRTPFASSHHIYDFLAGGTGPAPQPQWLDLTHTIEPGSSFNPYIPSASRLAKSGMRFMRDGRPQTMVGVSSFDLSQRLRDGDRRWIDQVLVPLYRMLPPDTTLYARVVVATKFRSGLTYAEGISLLPRTLDILWNHGIYCEVVAGVDTREFGLSQSAFSNEYDRIVKQCAYVPHTFVEMFNENTHPTQASYARDAAFREILDSRTPSVLLVSHGSTHGGESPRHDIGDFITHHSQRDLSSNANAAIMGSAQRGYNKPVLDDEPLGFAEVARPGARTNDPTLARKQSEAARVFGLAGTTLHLEAGLTASVDMLGPIQKKAIEEFARGFWG